MRRVSRKDGEQSARLVAAVAEIESLSGMNKTCSKCGGFLEAGFATARGLMGGSGADGQEPHLDFVVLGVPTSPNLFTALKQGLANEPSNRVYGIRGYRCSGCGALELYADISHPA